MIYEADVIIADLTGLNANVFYELGVAHTLGKKVISITQDISELPFDIRSYRATEYSTHFKKFDFLVKELNRYIKGAIDGSVAYGNPVTDFLVTIDKDELKYLNNRTDDLEEDQNNKGFIDHLSDIEVEMRIITDSLNNLTSDMNTMSSGIKNSTKEIERVNKTGGSGTASFMQKQVRKAAGFINQFSISLNKNNVVFTNKWPIIEQSCLSLLENKHTRRADNKEGLVDFLKSLSSMKEASLSTSTQCGDFTKSFSELRGIQNSLNQAVASIESDMKQFLSFIEQMCASIDRILDKSKFIVGDIDFGEDNDDFLHDNE